MPDYGFKLFFTLFVNLTLTTEFQTGTHSYSSQEPFWHIRDNDTDKEDDSLEPAVSKDQRQNKEGHAEEDSHTSDNVDEVLDLNRNRGSANFQTRGKSSDTAHHSAIASVDDDTSSCT